jgi:hypothetical protein
MKIFILICLGLILVFSNNMETGFARTADPTGLAAINTK